MTLISLLLNIIKFGVTLLVYRQVVKCPTQLNFFKGRRFIGGFTNLHHLQTKEDKTLAQFPPSYIMMS